MSDTIHSLIIFRTCVRTGLHLHSAHILGHVSETRVLKSFISQISEYTQRS